MDKIKNILKKLTSLSGISSAEYRVSKSVMSVLAEFCDKTNVDEFGNIYGYIYANNAKKTILLEAHIDRVGLMITKIEDNGFLEFSPLGGTDTRILPYSEVNIGNEPYKKGLIMPKKEKDSGVYEISELHIDTGYTNDEIKIFSKEGDVCFLNSEFISLKNDVVSCGGLDNRAGVTAVIDALSSIEKDKLKYNIVILLSVREELGFCGAYKGAETARPDGAIVIDVTHGQTENTKDISGVFPLGSGAIICRGPSLCDSYCQQLISVAKEKGISYDIEVASASSGTTSWAISSLLDGIPSALISIPLRYMHTNVEAVDLKDISEVSRLIYEAVNGGMVL